MSPVSKAKSNYTRKKNALTRLLDPIPAFLPDHSVGKLRLEEARKRCIVAWDALAAAYEELADVQSEEEAEDPEQEGRDAEFGNLEGRYHSMVDSLAETVLQRERVKLKLIACKMRRMNLWLLDVYILQISITR